MDQPSSLQYLFNRDLDRLKAEVQAYENEPDIWIVKNEIKNSAGNLCLHLLGNLNHFVGHVIGRTDYKRDREFEFSGKVSRSELINAIEKTKHTVQNSIAEISEEQWNEPFPLQLFDTDYSYTTMLIHLSGHLNYHLGQINYHRRLVK